MNIVFLAKFFDKAGTTTHMLTLGENLIKRGHNVLLICGNTQDQVQEELMKEFILNGFEVKIMNFKVIREKGFLNVLNEFLKYVIALPIAIKEIKKFNPDILHVHWPVTQYISKVYKFLYNKPFITTLHIKDAPRSILHQKPDGIIAISREVKQDALNIYNMNNKDIYTIFNGVDERKFNNKVYTKEKTEILKNLCINNGRKNILHVGSLNERKGIDILLKACSIVKKNQIKFNLILIGDGSKEWLENLIKINDLDNEVNIYNFQNPIRFYKVADLFVLASRKEGFPLVPIEAMLMGVAVIRSNVEGAYDQITHEKNGYLFESENHEELAQYLIKLLSNDILRNNVAEAGRKVALEKFTANKMANDTINAYIDLIERKTI